MTIVNSKPPVNTIPNMGQYGRQVKKNEDPKDTFMKVFLKQLGMQNPMKPYDSGQMLEQMSQLTSLQATQELEKTIKNMNANMQQSQALQASALVNRKVELYSKKTPLNEGEKLVGSVVIAEPASSVTITIKDAKDNVVKTIQQGPTGTGVLDFEWDGNIPDGVDEAGKAKFKKAEPGYYNISGSGVSTKTGQKTDLKTLGAFKVTSVALAEDGAWFNLEGVGGVKLNEIIKIL